MSDSERLNVPYLFPRINRNIPTCFIEAKGRLIEPEVLEATGPLRLGA